MKGDIVPDEHHVARLCGGSHIREDGTIAATAFKPRPGEAYLSVNWLEFLALSDRSTEVEEIRRVLGTKRMIGATARLAVLNVGQARETVRMSDHNNAILSILHEPETDPGRPQDPSHAGIYGVPADDNTVPELLAAAVLEVHQTRYPQAH
jgi:hypothetical protein